MTAHQTKSFKRKEVSLPLLLGIIGVSGLLILYFSGIFSFAAPISETDKVTVDGVENIGQYLTAMVLHTPSDQQNTPITLKYDPSISGLRIEGNINADAIIIEGITGSEAEKNISTRGNAVLGGKRNTIKNSTNNLVIGTERASISQGINSVVVGSHNTIVSSASNVFSMGTNSSDFSQNAQNIVAIGGTAEAKAVQNALALGEGNKTLASNSVLLGKSINAGGKDRIFVWSDSDTPFLPEKSNAFYVNTVNGFGLNTTQPTTQFDIGNAGALKVAKVTNLTPSNCTSDFAGMTAYAGNVFCGCNGKEWVPLTSDMTPDNIAACKGLQKVNCEGNINTDSRATNMGASSAFPLWNHETDRWEPLGWKYSSSASGSLGACQYNCEIGFHPGADNPEGWLQTGACKSCSPIANQFRWRTAGTGDDNCDFSCKASFKYANGGKAAQSCTDCEIGTWTPNDNQSGSCAACNEPAKLWRDTTPNPALSSADEYYKFTTKGTEANACNFDCAPRYQHYFNGKPFIGNNSKISTLTPSGNACIFCRIGTRSAGGKTSACENCTNKPADITYRVNENTDTLPNTASYTTNGDNNNCEWSCNYGLIKKGNSCECRDIRREHLEGRRCEPNKKSVTCNSSVVPQNATPIVVNQDIFWNGTWNNGKWSDPTPCDWKCNPGYKRVGDRCEKNRGGECSPLYHRTNQMTLSSSNDLCAYKNVVNFTATSNGWTWDCKGDEGMPSARCEAYKPNPQNGQCGAQHYECTKGSSINKDSPSLPNGRAWKCSGKDGGAAVQCLECDASKGYFLTNGSGGGAYDKHCGKLEGSKRCHVQINNLSCEEQHPGVNGWGRDRFLSYTYTGNNCTVSAIFDSWRKDSNNQPEWNNVAGHTSPSGDKSIVNSDGSITATRKLNDTIGKGYGPDKHTFYVDMGGGTSLEKIFNMYDSAKSCGSSPSQPSQCTKLDRNGDPFQWELALYSGDRTVAARPYDVINASPYFKDSSIDACLKAYYQNYSKTLLREYTFSLVEGRSFLDGDCRDVQLYPGATYYAPCADNNRCKFTIGNDGYRIKSITTTHIAPLCE